MWVAELSFVKCSIQALLSAPNPDDPLAENIAKEWKDDEAKAMRTGKATAVTWHCGDYCCGCKSLKNVCVTCSKRLDQNLCILFLSPS